MSREASASRQAPWRYGPAGALLALGLLACPLSAAQETEILTVAGSLQQPTLTVTKSEDEGKTARFFFTFQDLSVSRLAPTTPAHFLADLHSITATLRWEGDVAPDRWFLGPILISPPVLVASQSGSGYFDIYHSAETTVPRVAGVLVLTLQSLSTPQNATAELPWAVVIRPTTDVEMDLVPGPTRVRPFEYAAFQVRVKNLDFYGAEFRLEPVVVPSDGIDPATVPLWYPSEFYLEPGEQRTVPVSFVAPRDRLWYRGNNMIIQVTLIPVVGGGPRPSEVYVLEVSGVYANESLLFLIVAFLAQAAFLIWFILFARRAYERRALGRPIPPWRIPEERAHLERLKRDDPRAFYVTRYFLMEEEYRSALLWFYAYKKISKRQLKAEAKAVALRERADEAATPAPERFERASARLQRRYERRIERRRAWLERRLARLQRKLERNFKKDYDQAHETWAKRVERLKRKADRPYVRAHAKWERETKKILARWEKPFRRQKEKHEKRRLAALETYAKLVQKKDKPTWKAWRRDHREWTEEAALRKGEHRELPPEPQLLSAVVGPPQLPEPFVEPPKPELPPEPQPTRAVELPPEPARAVPVLAESRYARKARRLERKSSRKVRALERELAERLWTLEGKQEDAREALVRKHERYLKASRAALQPSFVDRVLRRTPEQQERRHRVAYLKGLAREKEKAAAEHERAHLERLRLEAERKEAELEARLQRERAEVWRASQVGDAAARAEAETRARSLEAEFADLRRAQAQRLALERRESEARLVAKRTEIEAWKVEALAEAERTLPPAAPAAAPQT